MSLTACGSLTITRPQPNLTYADPLAVSVSASSDIEIGSVRATLDTVDVSGDFVFDTGRRSLSASLPTMPGPHKLSVSANIWNGWYQRYDPKSTEVSFDTAQGGSLALTISPTMLTLVPGASQNIAVSITRGGAFQGDVEVDSGTGTTSIVIPASGQTGSLPVSIGSGAFANEFVAHVNALGTLLNGPVGASQPFTMRIGHASGDFSRAFRAASIANDTATGPDYSTTLTVQNGAPGALRFEARYRRSTGPLGATIGFDPGTPAFGGAGFCPRPLTAFVISGGSTTADHAFTFFNLDDPLPRILLSIPATASASAAVVEPVLFFSRNCGIAIAVGADTTLQQTFRAQVFDIHRRRLICSIPFSAPPATLQAHLDDPANNNQKLTVTVGGQATDCLLF